MFLLSFFISFFISSFTFIKGNLKSIIVLILIIFLGLFAGTRIEGVDPDYVIYLGYFNFTVSPLFDYSDFVFYEPCSYIVPNLTFFIFGKLYFIKSSFLLFAFIGVSLKLVAIKKYNYFFLSTILYCSYWFFGQEMITIRAGVACGLFLLAIDDLINKNDEAYFFKIALALLFHYSSVTFIIVWCIVRLEMAIKYFYSLLLFSIVIAILKINILTLLKVDMIIPKVKLYLDLIEISGGDPVNIFNFRILISLFFLFFFIFKFDLFNKDKIFLVLFKVHIISLCLFFILSPTAIVFSLRIFDMLSLVQILLFPFIVEIFKERFIGYSIIFLICAINFYYYFEISNIFNNYNSWLF